MEEGRQGVRSGARKNGAHHQGVHGTIEDPGGHLWQLPGTNLLEGTEVCCRRGQCPHSCGATIGGPDVLGPLRDGCSNAFLLAPLLFQEDRPTLVQVPKMFRDGRSVQGDHLESEASSLWNGDFPSILEGLYRNRTMAQMRGAVSEGEVRFVASEIDGSL